MASLDTRRLWVISWLFKFIPPSRGHRAKSGLLRWAGATVGQGCEIMSSVRILGNFELVIGNHCFLGHEALIFGAAGSAIIMDDYAKVGSRAVVTTGSHTYSPEGPSLHDEDLWADVRIHRGAVIGTGVILLPGVRVGEMSHAAAGGVVTRDVPEFCRVAGVPARVIRDFRASVDPTAADRVGD